MRVKHTLDIFIDAYSKILILGSFPSIRSREQGFYYMHPQNRFYKVLSKIFDEVISSDIDDRKAFLSSHHIALYDVIEECNITNSDDNSIRDVIPFDIESTLKKYPNIKIIGITGKKAQKLFEKYLLDKVDIPVIYLPSTSPANAKTNIDALVVEYNKLFKII